MVRAGRAVCLAKTTRGGSRMKMKQPTLLTRRVWCEAGSEVSPCPRMKPEASSPGALHFWLRRNLVARVFSVGLFKMLHSRRCVICDFRRFDLTREVCECPGYCRVSMPALTARADTASLRYAHHALLHR